MSPSHFRSPLALALTSLAAEKGELARWLQIHKQINIILQWHIHGVVLYPLIPGRIGI